MTDIIGKTVVARVDTTNRRIVVQDGDEKTSFGTVVMRDVEFGHAACRGTVVATSDEVIPTSRLRRRAYFNANHVERYVEKATGKVVAKSKYAYLFGRTVLFDN